MVSGVSRRTAGLALAIAAVAVALTASVAIAIDSSSEQDLAKTFAPKPTQVGAASARAEFAVANGKVGTRSTMAGDPMLAANGVDPAVARVVSTDLGEVTLVPGAETICIYAPDPRGAGDGGTCASYQDAKNGRLILTFSDENGEGVSVFAVVADGVGSVTGVDRSGTKRSVAVKNNVAAFKSANPAAVEIGEITSKL